MYVANIEFITEGKLSFDEQNLKPQIILFGYAILFNTGKTQ